MIAVLNIGHIENKQREVWREKLEPSQNRKVIQFHLG